MIRTHRTQITLLVGLFAAAMASRAHAIVPSPTAFEVLFSPSARVLGATDTPDFFDVQYDESCDNPHLRIRARNKPGVLVKNDDTSAAPITSFTLKINEGAYFFGTGDVATDNFDSFIKNSIYSDAGVIITGSSVSPDAKTLTVTFDGLTAGKRAIFNIDLDSSDPNAFMFPDYRAVLFGTPHNGVSTDPATASATFTGNTAAPNSRTVSVTLPDEDDEPTYMETAIRPYQAEDIMEVIGDGASEVPEPAGFVLAAAAFGVLGAVRRKTQIA